MRGVGVYGRPIRREPDRDELPCAPRRATSACAPRAASIGMPAGVRPVHDDAVADPNPLTSVWRRVRLRPSRRSLLDDRVARVAPVQLPSLRCRILAGVPVAPVLQRLAAQQRDHGDRKDLEVVLHYGHGATRTLQLKVAPPRGLAARAVPQVSVRAHPLRLEHPAVRRLQGGMERRLFEAERPRVVVDGDPRVALVHGLEAHAHEADGALRPALRREPHGC